MLSWKVIFSLAFIISVMEASPASVPSAALSFTAPPSVAGPTHLCVLAHGYVGTPGDLNFLRNTINDLGKGDVLAHSAICNLGRTKDGIRSGGERLADEITRIVGEHPSLKDISIVGNSLGGLYARYAMSILYQPQDRTIAGLRPKTFMTVATPHLGVRRFLAVPVSDRLHFTVPFILGKSGNDLFLRDTSATAAEAEGDNATTSTAAAVEQQPPLLLRMAQEAKFLDPLRSFQYRRAYGNVRQDLLVPFGTALFTPIGKSLASAGLGPVKNLPLPAVKANLEICQIAPSTPRPSSGRQRGYIGASFSGAAATVSGSGGTTSTTVLSSVSGSRGEATVWMEPFIADQLNSLGWTKIAVDFKDAIGNAHNLICALSRDPFTSLLFQRGRPVMTHAASFLVNPEVEEQTEVPR